MPEKPKIIQFPTERTKEGREKTAARKEAVQNILLSISPSAMQQQMIPGSAEIYTREFAQMSEAELEQWVDEYCIDKPLDSAGRTFDDQARIMIGATEYLLRQAQKNQ
ncbi:MAG: hypothetical protein JWO50_691 [Candidatus Kaiserbacteria bacterium]|nr:hypothetical protein [Candidatus Kaiserbacteria bacterium]